jgi:hypothetical protein
MQLAGYPEHCQFIITDCFFVVEILVIQFAQICITLLPANVTNVRFINDVEVISVCLGGN